MNEAKEVTEVCILMAERYELTAYEVTEAFKNGFVNQVSIDTGCTEEIAVFTKDWIEDNTAYFLYLYLFEQGDPYDAFEEVCDEDFTYYRRRQ